MSKSNKKLFNICEAIGQKVHEVGKPVFPNAVKIGRGDREARNTPECEPKLSRTEPAQVDSARLVSAKICDVCYKNMVILQNQNFTGGDF